LIVVVPQGDFGCWLNHAWNGPLWGDYVTRDLVAHIDTTYRTFRDPRHRAIGGLSTGGTGALVQAFSHPEVFAVVGAHSPTLREETGFVCVTGDGEEFAARDPVSLARSAPNLDRLWIWIDIGSDDAWYPRAGPLHRALQERGIAHEWRVWPGEHELAYTSAHIPTYLRYYSDALWGRQAPGWNRLAILALAPSDPTAAPRGSRARVPAFRR
jgi:enterochelin esterase-like enzyme